MGSTRGRPPLHPDTMAEIGLHARGGALAIEVTKGQTAPQAAVAELALIAPGRPDLADAAAAIVDRGRDSDGSTGRHVRRR